MKKSFVKIAVVGLASLAMSSSLVGCKSGGNYDPYTDYTNYKGLVVNFWHTFGKTPAEAILAKAKKFTDLVKENENVDVRIRFTYKGAYKDMPGYVTKSFTSGETPTITVAYPDHVADYFAAESKPGQYVVDLSKFATDSSIGFGKEAWLGDNADSSDFVEAFYEEGQSYTREGIYSLPYMKSSEVMFYNKDLLRKAMQQIGSDYTSDAQIEEYLSDITWEEFMDLCREIKDNNEQGEIKKDLLAPAFYDSDGNLIISKIFQEGIGFSSINSAGKGIIDFNGVATDSFTPSAEQTANYQKLQNLFAELKADYKEGLFVTSDTYGEYGSNNFTSQKTIFSIGSSGGAGYNFPSTKTFNVGIVKVPYSNDNPLYVSQGPTLCMLNSTSNNNDKLVKYGWKFLKYITNDQVNADLCVNGSEGYIPVRESAYTTKTFVDFMKNGEDYAKTADTVIRGIDGNYLNTKVFQGSAALRNYIGAALTDALLEKDGISIKGAIDAAISETIKRM